MANKARKTICFQCQGIGHVARSCPNKILISREEYDVFFAEETHTNQESSHTCDDDVAKPSLWDQ